MLFSVIVPVYNSAAHITRCLAALRVQKFRDWELVVVDNDSADQSVAMVRAAVADFPVPATILRETKCGASAARNRGATAARGEWLAFTDADCEPAPDWLADLAVAGASDATLAGLAGCITFATPRNLTEKCLGLYTLPAHLEDKTHHAYTLLAGGFPTANLAVRRAVFAQIAGFDERIRIYGEDHDLCRKIYDAGHGIRQLTGAMVFHAHRATVRGLIKQSFGFGQSHGLLMRRQPGGCFIVHLLRWTIRRPAPAGVRVWIDANQADKKMLGAILAGVVWTPLYALPVLYFGWLSWTVWRRARRRGMPLTPWSAPAVAGLLLLKSAALTTGRLAGSLKHRVVCA